MGTFLLWVGIILGIPIVGGILYGMYAPSQRAGAVVKEYKRTCQRCQTEWFVPLSAAREQAPSGWDMGSAKLYRAGKRASVVSFKNSAAELRVHNLEAKAERVQRVNSCPGCGSQAFTQQQMW